ncbi:MAG: apolipoprotein N-acyltransferase, partial [Chlamydiia bacterium]|nr:apolipoprotein N-acyltransferase [Chlamydiia bacterium]
AGGGCILFCEPIAAAVGYALFWLGLKRCPRYTFWKALVFGVLIQAVQLFWLASPEYHGLFIIVAYLLICLIMGLMWAAFSLLVQKESFSPIALASLWTLIEWSRLHLFCGYAWNHAGIHLGSTLWGRQIASISGVLGLTFIVILTNILFLKHKRIWAVLAVVPYLFGLMHLRYHEERMQNAPIGRAVLIQTGLLPEQKAPMPGKMGAFIHPLHQWKRVIHHIADADWIVLPEAAFPFGARTPLFTQKQIETLFIDPPKKQSKWSHLDIAKNIAHMTGAEVVIGLDDYDEQGNYNSAFHISPNGSITKWDKKKLLPIAECLPFAWLKPFAARYGIQDFFTSGKDTPITGNKVPLSASVCYDECFSHSVRCPGAKMHVNVTNDGWYPGTKLSRIHFEHGRLRAIENGICLLRACNTGITAGIDSLGRTISKLDSEEFGSLCIDIPLYSYSTPFARYGHLPLIILCFLSVGLGVVLRQKPYLQSIKRRVVSG